MRTETVSKAIDLKTKDFMLDPNTGRKTSSLGNITKGLEEDFVFSDEELNGEDDNSDDYKTPVKSKELDERLSVPAPLTTDLASKRSRSSPEEIRGYKKSKSGSDAGSERILKNL